MAQTDHRQNSLYGIQTRREDRGQDDLTLHRMSCSPCPFGGAMKSSISRRSVLGKLGATLAGILSAPVAKTAKAAVQKVMVSSGAPKGYDPTKHKWAMAIDVNRCIGCGLCAEACKKENHV